MCGMRKVIISMFWLLNITPQVAIAVNTSPEAPTEIATLNANACHEQHGLLLNSHAVVLWIDSFVLIMCNLTW